MSAGNHPVIDRRTADPPLCAHGGSLGGEACGSVSAGTRRLVRRPGAASPIWWCSIWACPTGTARALWRISGLVVGAGAGVLSARSTENDKIGVLDAGPTIT